MQGPRLATRALAHAELQNFCSASTRHWQAGCMHLIKVSVDINNSCRYVIFSRVPLPDLTRPAVFIRRKQCTLIFPHLIIQRFHGDFRRLTFDRLNDAEFASDLNFRHWAMFKVR